ncbi:unnamed protein product, partial [Brenthis ino]
MALYKLYSYNVEIQYKNNLLSKAALFTALTALINVILPFIIAYKSKGFWLQSYYFYEQPSVQSSYEYLLIAETDDPSITVICGRTAALNYDIENEEFCAVTEVREEDINVDGKNDILEFNIKLIIPSDRTLVSVILILGVDVQILNTCPLQMQSLAIINKEFSVPPNGLKYYGDLLIYQSTHLPCLKNILDTKYNDSLFYHINNDNKNVVDFILEEYLRREVISTVNLIYFKTQNGDMGTMDLNVILRIPEMQIRYTPSLLQELKWAWPQYLSLAFIFYHLIEKIKKLVFRQRLFMSWEIVPWKKNM